MAASKGKKLLEVSGLTMDFGGLRAVDNVGLDIFEGEIVALIGPNGAGKTTLLKLILGEIAPDTGSVRQGANLQVAYFDQMREALDLNATLEDFISPGSEWIEIGSRKQHVKSYLGDFLFSPARAASPVRSLSGGERNRLLLARLFARPANVLVLDEPTNDLDIDTLELLEELLQTYEGTVFLVSHDRAFLDNVVTSTIVSEGDGRWREYEGSVEDWLTQSQRAAAMEKAATSRTPPSQKSGAEQGTSAAGVSGTGTAGDGAPAPRSGKRKLSYKEQRELDALPGQIEALEAEQASIRAELADGTLYGSDLERAIALQQRDGEIEEALMLALERWEVLGSI